MKPKTLGRSMRVLPVMLLLVGSSGVLSGQSDVGKQTKSPFSITISTESPVVKSGSELSIKIHLTNTSSQDMVVSGAYFEGTDASYQVAVRDSKGNLAKREQSGPGGPVSGHWQRHTLKAGESTDSVTKVNGEYDISRPGQYVIQLSRPISANPDDGVVKSNKITVTVTP